MTNLTEKILAKYDKWFGLPDKDTRDFLNSIPALVVEEIKGRMPKLKSVWAREDTGEYNQALEDVTKILNEIL